MIARRRGLPRVLLTEGGSAMKRKWHPLILFSVDLTGDSDIDLWALHETSKGTSTPALVDKFGPSLSELFRAAVRVYAVVHDGGQNLRSAFDPSNPRNVQSVCGVNFWQVLCMIHRILRVLDDASGAKSRAPAVPFFPDF
jgi:hypothetical protein